MTTINKLINQLQQISPMPDDNEISAEILHKYEVLVKEITSFKNPESILPLINSFGYGEGNGLYWNTIHFIEEFSADEVDPLLITSLKSEERGIRMWAAYMLGRSRNRDAVDTLIGLLSDNNELVRRNAAIALGMIGEIKAKPYLEACKNDTSIEVRTAVKIALSSLS